MNVSCTSCSAKYAVPDEKVRGKKVKITCKHCGTGIIVDGTKIDAAGASGAPAPAKVSAAPAAAAPAAKAAPPPELQFDIAYPDERQETLSVTQIVDKYAAGGLDEDAFLWRDGMTDWKAPFDIPEIAAALTARGVQKRLPAPAPSYTDEDEATRVQESPFDVPDVAVRVELTAPSGDVWQFGADDADETVVGPAEDFCLVVTQRRHVDDTDLDVTGDAARDWMLKAQAFAGAATDGPARA